MSFSPAKKTTEFCLGENICKLLPYANEKRKSDSFNDINIQVGTECFPCNKMVLSCYSTYFETMFRTEMQERYQNTVEIQGFDGQIIKMLIDYMYGEKVLINDKNVYQVLAAADYLQMQDVKDFCIELLTEDLTSNNCLKVLEAYRLYMTNKKPDLIYQFISENFNEVYQQENFKTISRNDISTFLLNLCEKNTNQDLMFSAITSWVDYDFKNRENSFSSLFSLIDLSQLSPNFIEDCIVDNQLVVQNVNCLQSVVKMLTQKLKQNLFQNESKILSLCGVKSSSVFEVYNVGNKPRAIFPNLPNKLSWHCAEKVENFIFCVGGSPVKTEGKKVHRLNLNDREAKWEEQASMCETRFFHSSAVFRRSIVVSGGCNPCNLKSTEMYDIDKSEWELLEPMEIDRSGHAMVVCNKFLFAIGGYQPDASLSSVEMLDKLEGKWQFAQEMKTPRNRLAAVCLKDIIYAIGGASQGVEKQVEKSMEKFIWKESKWSYVSDMNFARWGHSACTVCDRIYVIGGKDENGKEVLAIECYDPIKDCWSIVGESKCGLFGHSVVPVG